MKTKLSIFWAFCFVFVAGCKKSQGYLSDSSAVIMVINGSVDLVSAQVNMESNRYYYKSATKLNYGSGMFYYSARKSTKVTAVNAADTVNLIVNKPFDFTGKSYTLYLVGQSPNVETLLSEERALPFISQEGVIKGTDSVVNVRFVNLSPNSVPLKVNIKGSTSSEVSSLSYKDVGGFKGYSAKTVPTAYIFEVRNQATDALLLTYTFSATATNRFKNVSLLIRGLMGTTTGTNALGISAINYF